ncbi:MAG: hypothetical protein EOQ53_27060, partial [Mesorhizobium sp.]
MIAVVCLHDKGVFDAAGQPDGVREADFGPLPDHRVVHVVERLGDHVDGRDAVGDLDQLEHDRAVRVADQADLEVDAGDVPAFGQCEGLGQRIRTAAAIFVGQGTIDIE